MCIIVTKIFRIYFLNRVSIITLGEFIVVLFSRFMIKISFEFIMF